MEITQWGNRFALTQPQTIHRTMPPGIYDLGIDENGKYQLSKRPPFQMPAKIYGDNDGFARRVLTTWQKIGHGIAVLLHGPKGCGKTLTAKMICLMSEAPVITISNAFGGPGFHSMIQDLPQPTVFFIDEFEKIYPDDEHRQQMLTILDGISQNRHLFILTSNEAHIGEFFHNRPGRIRYTKEYEMMGHEIAVQIVKDRMPKGKLREEVLKYVEVLTPISPDSLNCLITETLIHGETPKEFIQYLNVFPENNQAYTCTIDLKQYRRKGLVPKKDRDDVDDAINTANDQGYEVARLYYPARILKMIEETIVTFEGDYLRPFCNTRNPDPNVIAVDLRVREGSAGREKIFRWQRKNIEIKRSAGKIEIINKKENVVAHLAPSRARLSMGFDD